jgi:hypothetical protein
MKRLLSWQSSWIKEYWNHNLLLSKKMDEDSLKKYIEDMKSKGYSDNDIYNQLKSSGYDKETLSSLFSPAKHSYNISLTQMIILGVIAIIIIASIIIFLISSTSSTEAKISSDYNKGTSQNVNAANNENSQGFKTDAATANQLSYFLPEDRFKSCCNLKLIDMTDTEYILPFMLENNPGKVKKNYNIGMSDAETKQLMKMDYGLYSYIDSKKLDLGISIFDSKDSTFAGMKERLSGEGFILFETSEGYIIAFNGGDDYTTLKNEYISYYGNKIRLIESNASMSKRFLPEKCEIGSGLTCIMFFTTNSNEIKLTINNGEGQKLENFTIRVSSCKNNASSSLPEIMESQTVNIIIPCEGMILGEKFKSNLVTTYIATLEGTGELHTKNGEISVLVQN